MEAPGRGGRARLGLGTSGAGQVAARTLKARVVFSFHVTGAGWEHSPEKQLLP